MTKLFVLLLFIILSVSKQDSITDVDTEEIKKSDSSSYPCSSQYSENNSSDIQLPKEDQSSQHISNEENKDDKVPIVLECLVKIHERKAMESVAETIKTANLSSRRSPDIKYLIETKDNFRDFTTKRNRSKINREPTLYIDISEKCTKIETNSQKKNNNSGRRFNNIPYIDYIHKTKQSSENANSSSTISDLNLVPKNYLNSTNNQNKVYMEHDQELSTKKVSYGTTVPLRYHNQILSNKVTYNPSTQKYSSSAILHDKKIPKDMLLYLDLGNNEITDKPSTKKYDLLSALNTSQLSNESDQNVHSKKVTDKSSTNSTLTDGNKDSLNLLDFSNKKIGDKPSIIKYDRKSIFDNKTSEDKRNSTTNNIIFKDLFWDKDLRNKGLSDKNSKISIDYYEEPIYKVDSDKLPINKYEQTFTPTNKKINDLFLYHNLSSKALSNKTQKEDGDKHFTNKYEQTYTAYDDIYKDLLLHHDLDVNARTDKNIKVAKHQDLTQKVDGDKLSNNKYEKIFTPYDDISEDTLLYQNLNNKALDDKNIKIPKENHQDLIQKVDDGKLLTYKYEQTSTPNDDIAKDLLLYHHLANKALSGKNSALSKENHQDLHKIDGDKLLTTKYEQTSSPYDDIFKDLLLYLDLNNKAISNKNISDFKEHQNISYQDDSDKPFTYKYKQTSASNGNIHKDSLLYHNLSNSVFNHENNNITKENFQDLKHKEDDSKNFSTRTRFQEHPQDHFHKEDNDKYTTNKFEHTLTPYDDFLKDLLVLISLGDKALVSKIVKVFKDNYEDPNYNVGDDKLFTYKYEKTSAPNRDIYKDLLLHQEFKNNTASVITFEKKNDTKPFTQISKGHNKNPQIQNKEANDKPSSNKYSSSLISKDDIHNNLLILHDLGDKAIYKKNYSEKHHLKSVLFNNNNNDHNQFLSKGTNTDRLSNNKYDQNHAINHKIGTNLYPDFSDKEVNSKYSNKKYDLIFTKYNEVSTDNRQELNQKEIGGLYAIKGSHSYETPKEELRTTVDVREPHLVEPTTGYSTKDLFKARVMLLDSTRICYACSSISDHSCWQPSRSTTVKYCRKGHDACLTKTFKTEESEFIVVRDCGTTCDGTWPILDAKYKSCSICNEDMCNDHLVDINSGHINSFKLMYFVSVAVIIMSII